MLKFFYENNYRRFHWLLLLASIFALVAAYYIEYVLEIAPCPLCVYQRFPYLSLIKISLTAIIFKQVSKYGLFFASTTLMLAILIAGYHTGIEKQIFTPSALCSTYLKFPKHFSFEAMKNILYSTESPSCVQSKFDLLGITLTQWNLALNAGLLVLLVMVFIAKQKDAKA